jgi:RNA polymerase sigma factor (sigma-70 family)
VGYYRHVDLEETLRDLAPRLLRYGLARCGDRALAEEAAQDGLTALARRWRRSGPPDQAGGFAFAVTRRRLFRALARRSLLAPLAALANGHGRHPDPDADPERRALSRADLERTLAAIRALPRHEREALLLVAVGELSSDEAAALAGVSRSALKMRVLRARRRLQATLGNGATR